MKYKNWIKSSETSYHLVAEKEVIYMKLEDDTVKVKLFIEHDTNEVIGAEFKVSLDLIEFSNKMTEKDVLKLADKVKALIYPKNP